MPQKKNAPAAALLIVALILSIFAACAAGSDESSQPASSPTAQQDILLPADPLPTAEREPVRVGILKGPTGIGLARLIDLAAMQATQNDYAFRLEGAPDVLQGPLVSGELDIAILPTNLAAVLYNKTGGEVQLLAVSGMRVLYMLARPGVEISSVADLAGKTVYTMGQGATQEYVLDRLLRQNGLDPAADVTVEYTSEHAETASQLLAGNCDAALLPQPFATTVLAQDPAIRRVLDIHEEWDKLAGGTELTMSCVAVRADFARAHPEAVRAFVEEYDASTRWVTGNPAEAAGLVGLYEIIPAAVAAEAIPGSAIQCRWGKEANDAVMEYLTVLYEQNAGAVGGKLPDEGFFCAVEAESDR